MNVLLLLAVLSMLQATLTLPGIAAMALAIGVATTDRRFNRMRPSIAPRKRHQAG